MGDGTGEPISLASSQLQAVIYPALGGRVQNLVDLVTGREWFWTNPELPLSPSVVGADYDDHWQGGFEELFPNDAGTTLGGVELPDHGELWSSPWDVLRSDDSSATLSVVGPVTGVSVTKSFTLDGPCLHVDYELHNPTGDDLPHLFKLHPAIAVTGDCAIELPGGSVEPVDPSFSRILPGEGRWSWPGPPGGDVSRCHPPSSGLREFVYVHGLQEGWCAVTDQRLGRRLRLSYPLDDLPYCWLFLTYGGWRGHQVAVLEPCTNYPKDLHEAIQRGTTGLLPGGGAAKMRVTFEVEDV